MIKLTAAVQEPAGPAAAALREDVEPTLRAGCMELIRMSEVDAVAGAGTLFSLRGGLSAELNPLLALLETVGGIAPCTVERALHRAVDTHIMLRHWIAAIADGKRSPIEDALEPALVCGSWSTPFTGFSEWAVMFRFLARLSSSVPAVAVSFKVLRCKKESHRDCCASLAVLERNGLSKEYTCTMPAELMVDGLWAEADGTERVKPVMHLIEKRQQSWWLWLWSLWDPFLRAVQSEHEVRVEAVLRSLCDTHDDLPLDLHFALTAPCSGSNCPYKCALFSDIAVHFSVAHIAGVSLVLRHADILASLFATIGRCELQPSAAPWAQPCPTTGKDIEEDTLPTVNLGALIPDLSLPMLLADSGCRDNVWATLRAFYSLLRRERPAHAGCIHSSNLKILTARCLMHSFGSKWLSAFIDIYSLLLLSQGAESKKRKRDQSSSVYNDSSIAIADLHIVLQFAFQEPDWDQCVNAVTSSEHIIIDISDVIGFIALWCERGLPAAIRVVLNNTVQSSKLSYRHIYFLLRIVISILLRGMSDGDTGVEMSSPTIAHLLSRHAVTGVLSFTALQSIMVEELHDVIEVSESLIKVTFDCDDFSSVSNSPIGNICCDTVSSAGKNTLKFLVREFRQIELCPSILLQHPALQTY